MIDYKTASKEVLKKEYMRLAKVVSDKPWGTKKEFFHLPKILNGGEEPLAIASGAMDGNTWLIILTNQRVILLDKGMFFGVKQVDVNLKNIVSVGGNTGLLLGDIMISTSGQTYTIKNVMKECVIPFTNLINATRNSQSETSQPFEQHKQQADDLISQMERLAALKEKGILSDEEFQQQKQRILNG